MSSVRRPRSSCRTESFDQLMDLTLYGSPAPRCTQKSTVKSRRPSQPPNTPKTKRKYSKPLQLPIDKILKLAEKLETNNMDKIKLELSSRQIKLTDRGSVTDEDERLLKSESVLSPSTVDLSIDLSTVTDSDRESDTSYEDEEDVPDTMLVTKTRPESESPDSPTRYVWHLNKIDNLPIASCGTSETGYPSSAKSITESESNRSRDNTKTCFRSRSADLIHKYVSTVNDRELTKYFRPCHVCREACCVCPDVVPESGRSLSICSRAIGCDTTADKTTETDPTITEFGNRCGSDNSDFSNFLVERYLNKAREDTFENNDSGNSTLQLDEQNDSDRSPQVRKPVPMSIMQLATAAQCARILANSLESVLEIVDGDTEDCLQGRDLVKFKGEDLNQLFETLLSLKNHFSDGEGSRMEEKNCVNKWIDFDEAEKPNTPLDVDKDEECQNASQGDTSQRLTFEDNFTLED